MELIALLDEAGFDLVHPFDARAVAKDLSVPALADDARPRGWLVGNTRALWPKFLAARAADPDLAASADPLQLYVERTCARIAGARCLYSHRRYDGAFLPFQRIAVAAGVGTLARTGLVIHPTFGPWFALRAVVLIEGTPITRALAPPACDCAARCDAALQRARASGSTWREWLAVRDACCVGREHRYSDDQIAYHYTKSLAVLG
jgi:methylmalonic aciduria homocystinuria type C protein